jgi:hypothetical protein
MYLIDKETGKEITQQKFRDRVIAVEKAALGRDDITVSIGKITAGYVARYGVAIATEEFADISANEKFGDKQIVENEDGTFKVVWPKANKSAQEKCTDIVEESGKICAHIYNLWLAIDALKTEAGITLPSSAEAILADVKQKKIDKGL